jgi:thiol-disulfide isomerase/thioredoxin
MKKILFLAVIFLTATLPTFAQSDTNSAFKTLIADVNTKLKSNQVNGVQITEAALTPELKRFEELIAAKKAAKSGDVAEVIYMEAMLYLQVLDNDEKGGALMTELKNNYGDTKYGKSAAKIAEKIAARAAAKKTQSALNQGMPFPDFSVTGLDGKRLSVSALKGKVVLVDFWATWCGPCRAELPNVVAVYKKHHQEGFEIIGVSLDGIRGRLESFLKENPDVSWPQFFEPSADGTTQNWSNSLATKYGVESIPFAILIGPDGKIIDKQLRGDDLETAVATALHKK